MMRYCSHKKTLSWWGHNPAIPGHTHVCDYVGNMRFTYTCSSLFIEHKSYLCGKFNLAHTETKVTTRNKWCTFTFYIRFLMIWHIQCHVTHIRYNWRGHPPLHVIIEVLQYI